jgi:hypothetical protein
MIWTFWDRLRPEVDPVIEIQIEGAVRAHMRVHQRAQRSHIRLGHPREPHRFVQYALQHQRIDVDQARLQQVQRKNRELLILKPVGCDLAALAEKDEAVRAVPVLDDVETLVYLAAQRM